MGLGKTIQAIAVASYYNHDWPLLVICPSSLRFNWQDEIMRWLPFLNRERIFVVKSVKAGEAVVRALATLPFFFARSVAMCLRSGSSAPVVFVVSFFVAVCAACEGSESQGRAGPRVWHPHFQHRYRRLTRAAAQATQVPVRHRRRIAHDQGEMRRDDSRPLSAAHQSENVAGQPAHSRCSYCCLSPAFDRSERQGQANQGRVATAQDGKKSNPAQRNASVKHELAVLVGSTCNA